MNLKLDVGAEEIINVLHANGYQAYAVGGCVRDGIMQRPTEDWDITTSALPPDVKRVLSQYKTIDTGIRHGTVTAIVNKSTYEITTFRQEASYSDSRHPDAVHFVTDLRTDLSRRDFTMNAVAYNCKEGLIDHFGGVSDIENKVIRTVGNPIERFNEDALRILRALRFSAVLGFEIESETANAINKLAYTVKKVSPERIYTEIKKLICGEYANEVLIKFNNALSEIIDIKNDFPLLPQLPNDFPMRVTYLCGDNVLNTLKTLRTDNKTKNLCKLLLNSTPIPEDKTELKFYISALGRENAQYVIKYRKSLFSEDVKGLAEEILKADYCLSVGELAINGDDIVSLGIKGKAVSEAQNCLLTAVIKEEIPNQKEVLLERLKNLDIWAV